MCKYCDEFIRVVQNKYSESSKGMSEFGIKVEIEGKTFEYIEDGFCRTFFLFEGEEIDRCPFCHADLQFKLGCGWAKKPTLDQQKTNARPTTTVKVGATYKHFKGGLVKVLAVAKHSETNQELVVYEHNGAVWARPLVMFCENVGGVPRFEEIKTDAGYADFKIDHPHKQRMICKGEHMASSLKKIKLIKLDLTVQELEMLMLEIAFLEKSKIEDIKTIAEARKNLAVGDGFWHQSGMLDFFKKSEFKKLEILRGLQEKILTLHKEVFNGNFGGK